ncbi:MAG: response regulator [Acidobacteriota bacterium]|nr:response regulator [Acidobacteriota bacterium]
MGRYVLAAVDDMFFAAKIRGTAEQAGLEVRFAKSAEDALEKASAELPALIIADLHSTKCDPFDLARLVKADSSLQSVPLVGFFSHVRVELQRRALESGFDRVVPRSLFSKNMPEILAGNVN